MSQYPELDLEKKWGSLYMAIIVCGALGAFCAAIGIVVLVGGWMALQDLESRARWLERYYDRGKAVVIVIDQDKAEELIEQGWNYEPPPID
jgi:hypothetical protein